MSLSPSSSDDDSDDDVMTEMFGASSMTMNEESEESEEEMDTLDVDMKEKQSDNTSSNSKTMLKQKKKTNVNYVSYKQSINAQIEQTVKEIDSCDKDKKGDSILISAPLEICNKKRNLKNLSTPIDLKTIDTIYPADSVEFCHAKQHTHLCAVSTYKYDETKKERCGNVQFYSIQKRKKEEQAEEAQELNNVVERSNNKNTPAATLTNYEDVKLLTKIEFLGGILDAKWGSVYGKTAGDDIPILAVGTSLGYVSLLKPNYNEKVINPSLTKATTTTDTNNHDDINGTVIELNRFQAVSYGEIVLSLDWGLIDDGKSFRNQLLTTHSNSTVAIWDCTYFDDCISNVKEKSPMLKWRAHDLYGSDTEVWIGMFDRWHNNQVIYTGADDGKLKGWDLRANTKPIFSIQPTNNSAGVCSGQSSKFHEYIVATGGYDGIVRIWDTRMVCNSGARGKEKLKSLAEYDVGGGVWRIKMEPK
eukprot:g9621.t1